MQAAELVRDALTGAGLAGELTDQERRLLACFRGLNDVRRARALGWIEGVMHEQGEAAAGEPEAAAQNARRAAPERTR